jgi:hypothetical protein
MRQKPKWGRLIKTARRGRSHYCLFKKRFIRRESSDLAKFIEYHQFHSWKGEELAGVILNWVWHIGFGVVY